MTKEYIPFTYLIGWTKYEKYYYGVKYGKGSHPDMLWESYFTSSQRVKEFAGLHGKPDVIEVRKVFGSKEKSVKWEHTVLRRLKVVKSKKWFNQAIGGVTWGLMERTEEHRKNLSESHKGNTHTEESKRKIGEASKNRVRKPLTDEQKKRISEARKGIVISEEGRANLSKALKGKPKSLEHNKKVSESLMGHSITEETKKKIGDGNRGKVLSEATKERMRNLPLHECPYCKRSFKMANYARFHGDKCKLNRISVS